MINVIFPKTNRKFRLGNVWSSYYRIDIKYFVPRKVLLLRYQKYNFLRQWTKIFEKFYSARETEAIFNKYLPMHSKFVEMNYYFSCYLILNQKLAKTFSLYSIFHRSFCRKYFRITVNGIDYDINIFIYLSAEKQFYFYSGSFIIIIAEQVFNIAPAFAIETIS